MLTKLAIGDFGIWDDYVATHPLGSIFHQTKWLERIGNVEVLISEKDSEIQSGIAFVKTRKRGVKGLHIPPFTHYFGPLINSTNHQYQVKFLKDLMQATGGGHFDFKFPNQDYGILSYSQLGFHNSILITHILKGKLEEFLVKMNKNKKRELNKLLDMVNSNELVLLDEYDVNEVINLMRETGNRGNFRISVPIFQRVFLERQQSYIKSIYVHSKKFGLISAGIYAYDDKMVYNLINASKRLNHNTYKTINLLTVFKGIEFALGSNRQFDFEGSMIPGVSHFYKLMGGTSQPVYRVQKSPSLLFGLLRAGHQILRDRI